MLLHDFHYIWYLFQYNQHYLFTFVYLIICIKYVDTVDNWLFLTFLRFRTFSLLIPLLVLFHVAVFVTFNFFFYLKQLYSHVIFVTSYCTYLKQLYSHFCNSLLFFTWLQDFYPLCVRNKTKKSLCSKQFHIGKRIVWYKRNTTSPRRLQATECWSLNLI